MQILFLVDDDGHSWQDAKEIAAPILEYSRSLTQNVLLTDYSYVSNGIARQCMVLNSGEIKNNVFLSPSIIINLFDSDKQKGIQNYLRIKWANTQQCFWKIKDVKDRSALKKAAQDSAESSHCIAYTTNLESPEFKIVQNSTIMRNSEYDSDHFSGLIEQAVTEYFANRDVYYRFNVNKKSRQLKNKSSIFNVEFELLKENADFTVNILSISSLNFEELSNINADFLYEYLDSSLKFREEYFVKQVKFRGYITQLCEERGIDFEPSLFRTFVITQGDKVGLQRSYFGGVNDMDSIETVKDKHLTNIFLKERGFKTNASYEYLLSELYDKKVVDDIPIKYPLVLKPTDKKEGYGVVTNILNKERMLFSINKLKELGDIEPVLIEEFFVGVTYRILLVGGEVIAVLKFMPTYIIGNAKQSIGELIASKNRVLRSRIRVNDALKLSLLNDGYTLESVLPDGKKYILSHNSHAAMGGQATNVTDVFKDKYKRIATDVCKSLDITHAGIDMNINEEGDYRIIEVNCAPALSTHLYPRYGTPIDTYTKVLEAFFEHTDLSKKENKYLTELVKYHK